MRNTVEWGVAILAIALVAGAASFWAMRSHKMEAPHESMLDEMPELEWVRRDLGLSDEQFEKVRELHVAYRPKCVAMCTRVREAHERLDEASRDVRAVSPELRAAIENHAQIHVECQQAMLEHLYRTADVLDEEQAALYLDTMLPYALNFRHSDQKRVHDD